MALDRKFITSRVDWILRRNPKNLEPPVDLETVAQDAGITVRYVPMIPEGVFAIEKAQAVIYLQSNFMTEPSARLRQRFTFAHEICHSLFYDLCRDPPSVLRGTPRGDSLESLCHHGAGQLLVPLEQLLTAVGTEGVSSVDDILNLTRSFDVSLDVMIRRIAKVEQSRSVDAAFVLARRDGSGEWRVSAAALDRSFRTFAAEPKIGMPYQDWVQQLDEGRQKLAARSKTQIPTITSVRKDLSSRTTIHEVRLASAVGPSPHPGLARTPASTLYSRGAV